MTTQSGKNQKWTIKPLYREEVRGLFLKGLGATMKSPSTAMDVFSFDDGSHVGVIFADEALDADQAKLGAWLEFIVDQPERVAGKLDALGVARVDYMDKSHSYHQAPGGPIFRLA